jgi:hypothetical protein
MQKKKLKGIFLKELQDQSQLSEGVFLGIKNCHIWVSEEIISEKQT